MRKSYILSLYLKASFVLIAVAVFSGCKKHTFDEALPKVIVQSVAPHGADSVIITGNVTVAGVGQLDYVGFSYGNDPNQSITINQVLLNGTTGLFTAVVAATQDSTYYFKAFAANEFGYAVSSAFKYAVPFQGPAFAPCTLTSNRIDDNGSTFSVSAFGSSANPTWGGYMVTIYGTNEDIQICFPSAPHNGIYTTNADGTSLSGEQAIVTITNFNQYVITSGQSLYVAVDTSGVTTLSACSLQYSVGSSTATMYGKVTY